MNRVDPPPDLLPGTLHILILRTLRRGPLHGYAIARRIKEVSANALEIEEGSLYPALNRLLVKGFVAAHWGVSETNRKARFYALTPEGHKHLEQETKGFHAMISAIQLVLEKA